MSSQENRPGEIRGIRIYLIVVKRVHIGIV